MNDTATPVIRQDAPRAALAAWFDSAESHDRRSVRRFPLRSGRRATDAEASALIAQAKQARERALAIRRATRAARQFDWVAA